MLVNKDFSTKFCLGIKYLFYIMYFFSVFLVDILSRSMKMKLQQKLETVYLFVSKQTSAGDQIIISSTV